MPINDFKPFAIGTGANVTSQSDWENLPALLTGFSAGKASSAQVNKALRQATTIAALAGQFIADSGIDALDDGDLTELVTKFTNALGVNLNLGNAATKTVGTGTGQIPDMSSQQKGVGAGFGWQKLPSGLILQWGGTPTIAGSGSSVNVTFPIEFPNAVTGVVFQSVSEVSPSCSLFMHSDVTTSSMKVWGVAKVIAAGATTAPLSAGISTGWFTWGY